MVTSSGAGKVGDLPLAPLLLSLLLRLLEGRSGATTTLPALSLPLAFVFALALALALGGFDFALTGAGCVGGDRLLALLLLPLAWPIGAPELSRLPVVAEVADGGIALVAVDGFVPGLACVPAACARAGGVGSLGLLGGFESEAGWLGCAVVSGGGAGLRAAWAAMLSMWSFTFFSRTLSSFAK